MMPQRLLLLAASAIWLCAGCGSSGPAPAANPDQATALLRTALDAWKKGETPESLQRHAPPIWFNEHEHKAGGKLLDYKLDPPSTQGRQARIVANLTWQTSAGKKQEQRIAYLVDTAPQCVIVREEL